MNVYKDNLQYLEKMDTCINTDGYIIKLTYRKPRKWLWDKKWSIKLTYNLHQTSIIAEDLKYFRDILKK